MADNTVDSILLEIDATTDKADGGFAKTIKNLKSLKEVTEGIDTEKLLAIRDVFNGFKTAGESLKQAGDGMRSIASVAKSLSGIDSGKLKEVANAVEKIGAGLGNLGSNNKISIRIDSNSIQEAIKPLENAQLSPESTVNMTAAAQTVVAVSEQVRNSMDSAAQSAERLSAAENRTASSGNIAAAAQQAFVGALNQTNASSANAQIQELINKINEYKATISGMESGKQLFDSQSYEEAVSGLAKVQEQFKQYQESVKNAPKSMEDVAKSIRSIGDAAGKCGLGTFSSLLNGIAAMLPTIEMGGMAANAGFQSMAAGLQAVQSAIPIIGIILTLISALVNAVNAAANKIKTAFGKINAGFKTVVNKIRVGITKMMNALGEWKNKFLEMFGIQENSFESLSKKLKSLTRLFTFMALRKIITKIFEGATEGFQNLAKYSKIYGTEFNNNLSLLYSDLKWFGNSVATVFEPIINYVTPVLDMLIAKLVEATRVLAQFFSALTGKAFYTKAIRNWRDYADSIKNAAKAIKDYTIGIDELNILNDRSGSGSGANEIDPGDMFETDEVESKYKSLADMIKEAWENADFYDIGRIFGEKLKNALENIPWNGVKKTLRNVAKSIATFLNGFIETSGLFTAIGATIAQALNSAFEFVDFSIENFSWSSLGQAISNLIIGALDTIDWPLIRKTVAGLAQGLVDSINVALQTDELWIKMGTAIANTINVAILFAKTGILGFNWASLGKSIGNLLSNALAGIDYEGIGASFAGLVNGIFTAVLNFSETFQWTEVSTNFANGINEALGNLDWNTIKAGFTSFCAGLGSNLDAAIRGINWKQIGKTLGKGINTLIKGIGSFIASIDPVELGNSIADFINGAFEAFNSKDAAKTINMMIEWVRQVFATTIKNVDWQEVMNDIGTLLARIDWDKVFSLCFTAIGGVWTFKKIFKGAAFNVIGTKIVTGIQEGINEMMANIGEWLKEHFVTPIVDAVKKFFGIESESSSSVFDGIGGDLVKGFISGITGGVGGCQLPIVGWAQNIKDWFSGSSFGNINLQTWETYAGDIVSGFKDKIGNSYGTTQSSMTIWASDLKNWFSGSGFGNITNSQWSTYAGNIISGFKNKISSSYTECQSGITTWASSVKTWFTDKCSSSTFYDIASDVINGFKNGIGALYHTCQSTIQSWASSIADWFSSILDIHSPSKVFMKMGGFTVAGFNKGISESGKTTRGIVQTWADSFSDVDIGFKVGVDTSALKNYQNNYGADFANDAITARIRQEITAAGRTTIQNDSSYMGDLFRQAIKEELQPILSAMAGDVKRQADKEEQTIVQIGGKTITDVVETQQSANGFRFRPT